MELHDTEYATLLNHIDDLKKICENLKVNLNLLEIPIHNATRSRVLSTTASILEGSSESSSESSGSSDEGI